MNTTDTLKITGAPGTQNIEMTREFNATREQLLAAHMDPDLYSKWVGPDDYEMTINQFEPHHGGGYSFTHRNPEGTEFSFRGVFHGDPTVEGFSQTFEYLGTPGDVFFERFWFEDLGNGRTLLRGVSTAGSEAARDAMMEAMVDGVRDGYEKLDALLASL